VSAKSYLIDLHHADILRTLSAELVSDKIEADMNQLLTHLSFSHFIELLKAETGVKRRFYEVHAIQSDWSVRDLKRAIESLLYERTGLSIDKETAIKKQIVHNDVKPEDVFRNTCLLEFLGLGRNLLTANLIWKKVSSPTCRIF
jgi:hypothetical protein